MNNKEAVNWLINISADIGKAEHSDLWHYEQALTEIKDMLESAQLEERTEKRTETHACDLIRRKTGVWLAYTSVPGYMFCKCAACGADILVPYTGRNKPIFNYCPNCGAKMKGEMI